MNQEKRIVILTGEIESGKTSLLYKVVERLHNDQMDIAGVISPAQFDGEKKTGINLLDLRTGDEFPMAKLRGEDEEGLHTKKWQFFQSAVDQGNHILENIQTCNFLFIDELGPLEFERNQGWMMGFKAIAEADYQAAVLVVRPGLLSAALTRWPKAELFQVTAGQDLDIETEVLTQRLLSSS